MTTNLLWHSLVLDCAVTNFPLSLDCITSNVVCYRPQFLQTLLIPDLTVFSSFFNWLSQFLVLSVFKPQCFKVWFELPNLCKAL